MERGRVQRYCSEGRKQTAEFLLGESEEIGFSSFKKGELANGR